VRSPLHTFEQAGSLYQLSVGLAAFDFINTWVLLASKTSLYLLLSTELPKLKKTINQSYSHQRLDYQTLNMSTESKNLEGISRDALSSFYLPPPDDLPGNARKLLEDYSKIPSEQVLPHVVEVVRQ
jgi:hypothetical protein